MTLWSQDVKRGLVDKLREWRSNTSGTVKLTLSPDDAKKTLVQSFVSCRLDYCNALLYRISGGLIQRLYNTVSTDCTTGASRRDHITPVLRQFHWLPVKQRIDFKLAVFVLSHCMVLLCRTCRTTVNSSRTWDVDISGLPTSTRVSSRLADTVTDWWQEFLCSWTAAMEQPTDRDPVERYYIWTL